MTTRRRVVYQGSWSETQHQGFCWGLGTRAHSAWHLPRFQAPEGRQVFSIKLVGTHQTSGVPAAIRAQLHEHFPAHLVSVRTRICTWHFGSTALLLGSGPHAPCRAKSRPPEEWKQNQSRYSRLTVCGDVGHTGADRQSCRLVCELPVGGACLTRPCDPHLALHCRCAQQVGVPWLSRLSSVTVIASQWGRRLVAS